MESLASLAVLPEGCMSTILSLTSPADACNSSVVSSSFRSAVESDLVWERFLPSDYQEIVSGAVDDDLKFSSKKELYRRLCEPVLIDAGQKSFKLEKSSGRKSFVLSARDLFIAWSNDPMCWSWTSRPESRFTKVAELRTISWLEIEGKISTKLLSPNTTYAAYLILKISGRAFGLDIIPSETSIEVGNKVSTNTAYLRKQDSKKQQMERWFYMNRVQLLSARVAEGDGKVPGERDDGWMEIELGEFFNGEGVEEVKMSLREVKGHQLKGGLVIEGIEVRPKEKH